MRHSGHFIISPCGRFSCVADGLTETNDDEGSLYNIVVWDAQTNALQDVETNFTGVQVAQMKVRLLRFALPS